MIRVGTKTSPPMAYAHPSYGLEAPYKLVVEELV